MIDDLQYIYMRFLSNMPFIEKVMFWVFFSCFSLIISSFAFIVILCGMARKFLDIEFVDILRIRLEHGLQTLAVCFYMYLFLFLGISCGIIAVWLWFTPMYYVLLIYGGWFIYDYRTPERGGRRFNWVRNWTVWRYCRDYFPVTLRATTLLDPEKNYLMLYHPHGITAFGACINFATNATDFQKHFPDIRCSVAALKYQFMFPLCREYVLSHGVLSAFLAVSLSVTCLQYTHALFCTFAPGWSVHCSVLLHKFYVTQFTLTSMPNVDAP